VWPSQLLLLSFCSINCLQILDECLNPWAVWEFSNFAIVFFVCISRFILKTQIGWRGMAVFRIKIDATQSNSLLCLMVHSGFKISAFPTSRYLESHNYRDLCVVKKFHLFPSHSLFSFSCILLTRSQAHAHVV
jgi:hypothetical protein